MMAGIYVHIPFCGSRCAYCDFYSTTRLEEREAYVHALCRELSQRRDEFAGVGVHTVYFGGGTPSMLTASQLREIQESLYRHYAIDAAAEVTIEMNPDDVQADVHERLLNSVSCVNRVSLGIQSFDDALLRLIRRRHDGASAIRSVICLQEAGIDNISIDLIYGLPGQTLERWEHDLDVAFSLGVQHLSAYALSYESGTPLTRWRDEGRVCEVPDELQVTMYQRLCQRALDVGFEHYEISNFALPGFRSRHNSSYWTGQPYLGFGPAAHSYDGQHTRRANAADLTAYLRSSAVPHTVERLSEAECYDEAVMCGLRTAEGIDLDALAARFGTARYRYLLAAAAPHLLAGRLQQSGRRLRLSPQALMTSDDVMSDLMASDLTAL